MSSPTKERIVTYVEALREATAQEMGRDPTVVLFGLDVEDHKAIQGSTRGLVEQFGRDRVFHTPLSEDAMTGVAIGAAMAGLRPIHVHIRMDFLLLCMNQLINVAAKAHYMYGGKTRVPLVVRSMIGKSWGQGAQHSQGLHGLFAHVPGLKVVAPSNAHDAKGCLIAAIRDENPVIFTEHRLLYFTEAPVAQEPHTVEFGKARICMTGDDIILLGVSNMVVECLRVGEILSEAGIAAEIIDPISLVPLDINTILQSAEKTGRLLIVDNAWTNCGFSAEVAARVAESANRHVQIRRMGFAPTTCPTTPSLEELFYPNPRTIAQTAYSMVRPDDPVWEPSPESVELGYQMRFKGPF